MAVNHRGKIIVVETTGWCIPIFSPTGDKLRSFGSEGYGPGQFWYPCGITVDDNDNILAADGDNYRIQIFPSDLIFITSIGSATRVCNL